MYPRMVPLPDVLSPGVGADGVPCPPSISHLNGLLGVEHRSGSGAPLRFVEPDDASEPYESRAFHRGEIVTRPGNWHDAFNAAAWIAWPRTKRLLNRLHHEHWLRDARNHSRGTARDVLTLFDEGGMIVACVDGSLAQLMTGFQWKTLFWQRRAEVGAGMRFQVFGHALADMLREPFRGMMARALIVPVTNADLALPHGQWIAMLDERAEAWFARPESLSSTRLLSPLPVLGIPGWDARNESESFYDDTGYFRPGRGTREAHRGVHSTG